jgi:hypothetical protein
MNRKFNFDLNVEANALLCPNPAEFYSKAYISEDIVGNYRSLPGIKSETKLANVLFENVLKPSTCNFDANPSTLDAIDINVCPLSGMAEICQFDLEQSFVALQMASGSNNGEWMVSDFLSFFWSELSAQIFEEIELLRWNGDTSNTADDLLKLCDGYIVKFVEDEDVVALEGEAITSANVLAEMVKVYEAIPTAVRAKTNDLRIYVAPNVAAAYRVAAATGNTLAYITKELDFTFLGIKIVEAQGMPADTIVATLWSNMIYAFDGAGDGKALKIVNLSESVAEPYLRARTNLKVGFHYTNPEEIVFYSPLVS